MRVLNRASLQGLAALAIASLLLLGCSAGGSLPGGPAAENASTSNAMLSPAEQASLPSEDTNRIRPRDTIDVNVQGAAELNRTTVVDPLGRVNLPLIGLVPVAGKTPEQAGTEIASRYGAKYLRSPVVLVTLKQSGQVVTVTGAVGQAGTGMTVGGKDAVVPYIPGMTLSQAIIAAGGLSEVADGQRVHLARKTAEGLKDEVFDYDAIVKGAAQDPPILGGDMLLVERTGYKVALKSVREIGGYMFLVPLATGM